MIAQAVKEAIGIVFAQGAAGIEAGTPGTRESLSIDKRARGIRGPIAAVARGAK